jgi:hypothetical protein
MSKSEQPPADHEPAFANRREAISAGIGLIALMVLGEGIQTGEAVIAIPATVVAVGAAIAGKYFHSQE